jgi:DNA-binding CsgD family transcriptional regulator
MDKKLTEREREVSVCLINGMKTKEIAKKLDISLPTAQEHQRNIKHKLNSKTMCQLGAELINYLNKY